MRARRALSNSGRSAIGIFTSAGLQAARAVLFLVIWDGAKKNAVERQEDGVFLPRLEAMKQQQTDSDPLKDGAVTCANATDKVDVQALLDSVDSSQDGGANELVQFGKLSSNAQEEEMEVDFEEPACFCDVFGVNKEVITRNTAVAVYGVAMACGAVALTIFNIDGTTYQLLCGCVVISVVFCAIGFVCITTTFMKANSFPVSALKNAHVSI